MAKRQVRFFQRYVMCPYFQQDTSGVLWVTVECNPHPHLLRVSPLVPQEVLGTLALAVVAGIIGYRAYLGSLSPGRGVLG